jgi:hypothetical protein
MDSATIAVYYSGRSCVLESMLTETERASFLCTCKLTGIIKLFELKEGKLAESEEVTHVGCGQTRLYGCFLSTVILV